MHSNLSLKLVIKTKAMSPQFHGKKEITSITIKPNSNSFNGMLPPPLKMNKYSHSIKKSTCSSSPPSSSTSSSHINSIVASNKPPQQHRHPVIIYTHSPRVIKTHPSNFMALVQKLTGLSHTEENHDGGGNGCNPPLYHQPKQEEPGRDITMMMMMGDKERNTKKAVMVGNEDNDTSSVITEEENNCSSNNIGENQVNWCFNEVKPAILYEPPFNPYMTNLSDFMYSNQPLFNCSDSLFLSHKMRTSIPSSATLEGTGGFGDY